MEWHLKGYDEFDGDFYPLPGEYATKDEALIAADERFDELEKSQPSSSSGGQEENGIQDQVFLVAPDGSEERLFPGCSGKVRK